MIPDMWGFGGMLWKTLAESTNSTRHCSAHFTEDYFEAEGQSDSLVLRLKDFIIIIIIIKADDVPLIFKLGLPET